MPSLVWVGVVGVIKTWTEVAARVRLYMLTSDLTSLVPPQFSHWLQVRKVGTAYFFLGRTVERASVASTPFAFTRTYVELEYM